MALRAQKVSGCFEKPAPVHWGPLEFEERSTGSFSQIAADNRFYMGVHYFLGVVTVGKL